MQHNPRVSAGIDQSINTLTQTMSQMQTSQNAIVAAITNAVNVLPTAGTGSGLSVATPTISTDPTDGMRFRGMGLRMSFEADCGTINPCDLLRALNGLRNLA